MKKLMVLLVAFLMLIFCSVTASQAVTLGFGPVDQNVSLGSSVDVDLVISELGDYEAPSLSAFDLDIGFNPTILAFNSATFGDPIWGDLVDISGDAAYWDSLYGPGLWLGASISSSGVLDIFETSFDSAADLNSSQPSSFTLATLTFDTLAVGNSGLGITDCILGDDWGYFLTADLGNGSVTVTGTGTPVPEPATILLLATGLAGAGILRKKKKVG